VSLVRKTITTATEWHTVLASLPLAHPLQSWVWGQFKSRWGWTMEAVAYQENAHGPTVAAALILKRKIPYTPFSLWYTPKGPVVDYENSTLRTAILADLQSYARRSGAIALKIDPDVAQAEGSDEIEPLPLGTNFISELKTAGWQLSNEQIQFRNTVFIDLDMAESEIMKKWKQKTRYNTRLAVKKGVTVRAGTADDFPLIYQLYAETAERDNFLIRPEAYYLDIWRAFYDAGMCLPHIAEYEGEPLAAVITVTYGDLALYMYGASNGKERNRMPTYQLQWEAMKWAKSQGCTIYDMWGAPDKFNEDDRMWGVWRFKKGYQGRVAHHIGAWDYPVRPFLYRLYTELLPRYVAFLRRNNDE